VEQALALAPPEERERMRRQAREDFTRALEDNPNLAPAWRQPALLVQRPGP
jgi:hypothetical protein